MEGGYKLPHKPKDTPELPPSSVPDALARCTVSIRAEDKALRAAAEAKRAATAATQAWMEALSEKDIAMAELERAVNAAASDA